MSKRTYNKNDYTSEQWKMLIDKAVDLHCLIKYDIYGIKCDIYTRDITIDDEYIHSQILGAIKTKQFKVQCRAFLRCKSKNIDSITSKVFYYTDKEEARRKAAFLKYITCKKWEILEC